MTPSKNPKSKKFRNIIRRGLGEYSYSTPNGEKHDCHFYDWESDYCLVLIDKELVCKRDKLRGKTSVIVDNNCLFNALMKTDERTNTQNAY
jgi:hypothetical protein